MLALILCLSSLTILLYVYIGYPLLVTLAAWLWGEHMQRPQALTPDVTLIFCAHNEAAVVPAKIANCQALDYPPERLTFCVASDASTDATNALLEAWFEEQAEDRTLLLPRDRLGKTALLNILVRMAHSEIVFLTDASTILDPDAIRRHVAHYADPQVGCVGGDLHFVNTDASAMSGGHGLYWRYERHLRRCESALGILAYVAGAHYSIRRDLWKDVAPHFADDCHTPLHVIEQGARVVYEPLAVAHEVAAESPQGLWRRRVRMVTRDLEGIFTHSQLLNPLRYPGVAWSLWSHKILRWLGAPLLMVLFISNWFLLDDVGFTWLLILQLTGMMFSVGGYFLEKPPPWLAGLTYFTLSQLAILRGMVNLLQRQRAAIWQPGGRT